MGRGGEIRGARGLSGALVWVLPPFTAVMFVLHLVVAWKIDPRGLLLDPGLGWHLTTGRYILATHSVPAHDLFSYTAAGREWISDYWLFEVIAAMVVRAGGLPLYAAVCVLVYAALPALLLRRMLRIRAGLAPAIVSTLGAYIILSSHALARPHIVTYLFFALFLERVDRVQRAELPYRALWWIPALMLLWCNMHGGFVAGLALVAIYAAAATVRWALTRDVVERRRAVAFTTVVAAMTVATLVNPAGTELHRSILEQINPVSAGYFNEWHGPNFMQPDAAVRMFEWLILALIGLLVVRKVRLALVECVLLAFFLHQALHSVRHMNLFAIVAAPIVARELSALLDDLVPRLQARLAPLAAQENALRSAYLYFPAIVGTFLALAAAGRTPFPTTLNDLPLSGAAIEFIADHRDRFARMFNSDDLGGPLIYHFWPELKVFVDDRFFVYGDDFIVHEYIPVLFGERQWHDVLRKHDVTAAVLTPYTACDTLFRTSDAWDLAFEDPHAAIFFRKNGS